MQPLLLQLERGRIKWNKNDKNAVRLVALGYANLLITRITGLTPGQILWRSKLMGVRRSDYRNGTSRLAQYVVNRTLEYTDKEIANRIRAVEGKINWDITHRLLLK